MMAALPEKNIAVSRRRGAAYIGLMAGLGDRAKRRRLELGLSKTEVAKRVNALGRNCKIQHINWLESGKVKTIGYLVELAKVLDVDPTWLQTGKRGSAPAPIDSKVMLLAWDAANVVIDEHNLPFDAHRRMDLAVKIYQDLTGGVHSAPAEAAKAELLRLLAKTHRQ